jgi:hypothetical protein
MPSTIRQSHYYATPRALTAGAGGAFAVASPTAAPTSGERVKPGQLIGASTGQVVMLKGQAPGKYFVEVRRPSGQLAWVLSTGAVLPGVRAATPAPVPAPAPRPATGPRPVAKPASKPVRPVRQAPAPTVKTGDGASALQAIIANDQKTHLWLVQALYWKAKVSQLSGPTADLLDKKLSALIASYNARQQKIKQSRYVKVSTGVNDTVQGWLSRLKGLVGMNGIGILPALPAVPILVGVVVGAALIGGLWLLLRDDVPRSVNDLQQAAKLTETYRSMSPEEKELFDKTTEDAAKAGAESVDDTFFGKLKNNALLIAGAILLYAQATKNKK